MSAQASSSKKRRRGQLSAKVKSDAEIEANWKKDPPAKAHAKTVRYPGGSVTEYDAMSLRPGSFRDPPPEGSPDSEYEDRNWVVQVASGRTTSLCFPVQSRRLTPEEYKALSEEEKERCVPDEDEHGPCFHYCARHMVHGGDAGEDKMMFLANCVRMVRAGEIANCRLMLDWDFGKEPGLTRCMLVSIMKTQSPTEWKLDRCYARRKLGLDDEEEEESEPEAPEPALKLRSLRSAREVDNDDAEVEFRNRLVSALESCTMHLGNLDHIRGGVEHQITVTTRMRQEYRNGNAELGVRLGRCVELLERVANALAPLAANLAPVAAPHPEVAEESKESEMEVTAAEEAPYSPSK